MTHAYAPAYESAILGEPSYELVKPRPGEERLPRRASIRFGGKNITVEDPEYCRQVAKVWLAASYDLDAAAYARQKVALELAPVPEHTLDAAGPVAPASTPPEADESAGPAARNGWAAPVITLYAANDLEPVPDAPEMAEPCGPCQFGNHEACKLARPDGEVCPCHVAGHPVAEDEPEPEPEDEP